MLTCARATVVGMPKFSSDAVGTEYLDIWAGNEAIAQGDSLAIKRPTQQGVIQDWNDTANIWAYAFQKELRVEPSEHNLLHGGRFGLKEQQRGDGSDCLRRTSSSCYLPLSPACSGIISWGYEMRSCRLR